MVSQAPILVDTSAWIEFLRRTGSEANVLVRAMIDENQRIATTDIVIMEVLMGASTRKKRGEIWALLNRCVMFPVRPLFEYERAAELYVRCRANGFTPANSNDLLIASVAIGEDVELLDADSDFGQIAAVSPLRRHAA